MQDWPVFPRNFVESVYSPQFREKMASIYQFSHYDPKVRQAASNLPYFLIIASYWINQAISFIVMVNVRNIKLYFGELKQYSIFL